MVTTALDSYRRHRFAWRFFSLLLTLSVYPVLEALVSGFNEEFLFVDEEYFS